MRSRTWSSSRHLACFAGALVLGLAALAHADRIGSDDFDADALVLSFDSFANHSPISNDFECSERVILSSTAPIGKEFSADPADWLLPGEGVSVLVAAITAVPSSSTASPPNKVIATKYDAGGGLTLCERCGIAIHFLDPLPTKVGLYVTDPDAGQSVVFSGNSGLLGSVSVIGASGNVPEFVGWTDPGGIAQVILRSRPSAGIGFDNLTLSGKGPAVCAPLVPDADADGEADASDLCPATPAGEPGDTDGCSLGQFCSGIDARNRLGRLACTQADWKDDEPLDARDCKLESGSSNRQTRCLVR